jgi:hypothetical protein
MERNVEISEAMKPISADLVAVLAAELVGPGVSGTLNRNLGREVNHLAHSKGLKNGGCVPDPFLG